MKQYDSLRLAMISGKGGVGKTTFACGFARRWAKHFPQEQVLLLSTDPAHSLGDVLQLSVTDTAHTLPDLHNLQVQALDAPKLLSAFKARYGKVLELLVERGSFVGGEDLTPIWDLSWPGLDELMGILEIQRLLHEQVADRVVVDMAPSGHTLNLFELMDFLDGFLAALTLFQQKHHLIRQTFAGTYTADEADIFLQQMQAELIAGRRLLQNQAQTACLVVVIPEPMSWLETKRFLEALQKLQIPCGGLFVNRLLATGVATASAQTLDRLYEQQELISKFLTLANPNQLFCIPQQPAEPVGPTALDHLISQTQPLTLTSLVDASCLALTGSAVTYGGKPSYSAALTGGPGSGHWLPLSPCPPAPTLSDFVAENRQLILVGGKGGVGKTTVAAAIGWAMAQRYPERQIRVISIDPAHSLGDAFAQPLGHQPTQLTANLSAQEVDADQVLVQFREDYLWELAEMMSGSQTSDSTIQIAYGPQAWRQIAAQALPGIDEMLSLITVMNLLDSKEQDLIILDTAPTGHLLRFLEMPNALGDWLAWIFKLWIKYQAVLGRVDFMGRLRGLRQQVLQAQKKLQNPQHTEFIGVLQAESAIVAEAERLTAALAQMQISQRYIVHNRFEPGQEIPTETFPAQTLIHLPTLPRSVPPLVRIQAAAQLLL